MSKIKITGVPKGTEPIKVNKTLKPVDREDANMEAERGEIVITDSMVSGLPEAFKVGGERHSQGGTPLDLSANSFIFSRDKSLRIKNPEILETFGKKAKKVGYAPAEIAKQYDINEYRKTLADPDSDKLQRDTAELMIQNYNSKIGKLSLVQESMKGFPDGIPFTAMPYLERMGIDPASLVHGSDSGQDASAGAMMREGGEMKIRIVGLPKAQKGGPAKGDEFVFNDEFMAALSNKLGAEAFTGSISPFMAESQGMVGKQKAISGKGAVHGRVDWTDAEHFPDFRNRNAWYFQQNPGFNPRDPKQVEDFQRAYNERATNMVGTPYFKSTPGSKYSVDGKFGEVTFNTPNLDFKPSAPATAAPAAAPLPALVAPSIQDPVIPPPGNNPFWTQDLVKMYGAGSDYAHINKYLPWQAGYQTLTPNPTFYDPTRELAANSEQVAMAGDVLGAFAGPQQLNARLSEVQGRGLENAANILGKYNTLNVGVANEFEQSRVSILNADSLNRANRATDLYDKTVMVNQQFDNAKMQARQNIRDSFVSAWTNRGKTQALNAVNKQYRVDPRSGFVSFTGVPGKLDPAVSKTLKQEFDSLMSDPNMRQNPELAYKIALKSMGITDEDQMDARLSRMMPY